MPRVVWRKSVILRSGYCTQLIKSVMTAKINVVKMLVIRVRIKFLLILFIIKRKDIRKEGKIVISWLIFDSSSLPTQTVVTSLDGLTKFIDLDHLTSDLGGSFKYDHSKWIKMRMVSSRLLEVKLCLFVCLFFFIGFQTPNRFVMPVILINTLGCYLKHCLT